MKSRRELTSPCGLDCFNCQIYEGNITEQMKMGIAAQLSIEPDQVACKGCREQKGRLLVVSSCATLECAVEQGVEFCNECDLFPCAKLQPAADGANRYPHNIKLYNLCRIRLVGFERWAEEAIEIRRRYFQGKFVVGQGPQLS